MKLGDLFVFKKDIAAYVRLLIREDQTIIIGVTYTNGPTNFMPETPYTEELEDGFRRNETIVVNNLWRLILKESRAGQSKIYYFRRVMKLIW
jgi:hypothetical protein